MRQKKAVNRYFLRSAGILLSATSLIIASRSSAFSLPESPPSPAAPAFALKVSPTRLVMSPDQATTVQHFKISNTGKVKGDVNVSATSMEQHADGSLTYPPTAPYSAANWVAMTPQHFQLDPGATQKVTVHLTVPAAPEPGEHYVALLSLVPSQAQNRIRINRGVAVPLLVTVRGSTIDAVKATNLETSGLSVGGPISLTTTVKETGTVHHDFYGPHHNLVAEADGTKIAFSDFTVLRGSSRTVKTQWTDPPLACVCHIKVAIPQKGSRPEVVEATVVRLPLRLVGEVVMAIISLFLLWRFGLSRYTLQRRDESGANDDKGSDTTPEDEL
ncbi:hypothetical protein [Streptomyces mirabilis]|uniref:hypothetical protein n=1 Tax=Streptomyces mirabilis TaxID=68239 RepID=UPI00225C00B9|nr:hypothetical protein [Streptomyces mirabilis]MCX4419376.1 hypothetical protein [Streptomyces mirabilis]